MSVKEDLIIDPYTLDEQWSQLPILYHTYMEEAEALDGELRSLKMKEDRIYATTDLKIRRKPDTFNIEGKPAEGMIKAIINSSKEIKEIRTKIIETEKQKRLTIAVCRSLEMKKEALKQMTNLYLSDYYTAPPKAEANDFISKQEQIANKDVRKKVKKSLNRKNKETKDGTGQED